jgi:hypothetical protein
MGNKRARESAQGKMPQIGSVIDCAHAVPGMCRTNGHTVKRMRFHRAGHWLKRPAVAINDESLAVGNEDAAVAVEEGGLAVSNEDAGNASAVGEGNMDPGIDGTAGASADASRNLTCGNCSVAFGHQGALTVHIKHCKWECRQCPRDEKGEYPKFNYQGLKAHEGKAHPAPPSVLDSLRPRTDHHQDHRPWAVSQMDTHCKSGPADSVPELIKHEKRTDPAYYDGGMDLPQSFVEVEPMLMHATKSGAITPRQNVVELAPQLKRKLDDMVTSFGKYVMGAAIGRDLNCEIQQGTLRSITSLSVAFFEKILTSAPPSRSTWQDELQRAFADEACVEELALLCSVTNTQSAKRVACLRKIVQFGSKLKKIHAPQEELVEKVATK